MRYSERQCRSLRLFLQSLILGKNKFSSLSISFVPLLVFHYPPFLHPSLSLSLTLLFLFTFPSTLSLSHSLFLVPFNANPNPKLLCSRQALWCCGGLGPVLSCPGRRASIVLYCIVFEMNVIFVADVRQPQHTPPILYFPERGFHPSFCPLFFKLGKEWGLQWMGGR